MAALIPKVRRWLKSRWLPNVSAGELNLSEAHERRLFSQHGEDGILQAIFERVTTTNRFCVEFGVEGGTECNTRRLIELDHWDSLQMDAAENASRNVKGEFVTAENICELLRKYAVPRRFDLLSIDIDYNDYWVWRAIRGFSPRVVVIEYNASIPPGLSKAVPYDPSGHWDGWSSFFGASLSALEALGKKKGYSLVYCESFGANAFFVRSDIAQSHLVIKPAAQCYRPPKYVSHLSEEDLQRWHQMNQRMIDV